jgi:hypothetical protein
VIDVDADGDPDYIGAVYSPGPVFWLERPTDPLQTPWPYHLVDDEIDGMVSSTRVARLDLQVAVLRAALERDFTRALSAFEAAQVACAPYERAECAVDLATVLVDCEPEQDVLLGFLRHSAGFAHHGLRHRAADLRSRLLAMSGDVEGARAAWLEAERALATLNDALPDEYRERLAEHPWVLSMRRVRAVP